MACVYPIVEGHGDVQVVPILLRRIATELLNGALLDCCPPYRLPRSKLMNGVDLAKVLAHARNKLRGRDFPQFVLILADVDDDCVKECVENLRAGHNAAFAAVPTSIVFAVREYEAWFLASGINAAHHRHLRTVTPRIAAPEETRDAKGRFQADFMLPGRVYSETVDQAKYTACLDLNMARSQSPSFDKLVRELGRHLNPR